SVSNRLLHVSCLCLPKTTPLPDQNTGRRCLPFLHLNKQTLDHNRGLQRRLPPEFGQPNKTGESKTAYSRLSFSIGIEYDPKLLKNCNNQISDGKQKGSQW